MSTSTSSPLANRAFRRLFAAQTTSLLGTGLASVALALLAYDLAGGHAGEVLGTALAIKMIAYVAVAPVAGVAARLLPRRGLLVSLDLIRAAAVCLFPFVDAIWQVYVLIAVISACSGAFTPIFQATLPELLPDERQYTRALSLSRLAYDLENLISPAAAAAALTLLSYRELFTANAAAFAVSAALIVTTGLPKIAAGRERINWQGISRGSRIYFAIPRLRGLFALSLATAAAGAMVIVNTVVYVRQQLAGSESATAIALAAFGFGSMAAALSLPRLIERLGSDRPPMLAGALLLAGGMLAGAAGPGYPALLAIWAAVGIGYSLILTPAGRLLQRSAAAADRPALYAAQFALSHACWLITYPLAGLAAAGLGFTAAFVIMAAICLAAAAAAGFLWQKEQT